jgi:hypothetical protein
MGMFFLYFGACVNYDTRKECSCPAQFWCFITLNKGINAFFKNFIDKN